ncbi:DUF192 domain-containing protein [Roseinatronobacter alkalisoli]|uniref:DUF192 domain-containing protein n=1 Tax=Roseinatronobacter alkalisoli TaxID=3028235 RepID=A0ABT5TBZ4_9RHOB|nr:DUF192 domain-containing protein [Roseinatronobacter sp. HJB301]MDD7972642.1 DUF192 domain-containing protein [Roseinatronobacter sp. HJB301]
MFRRGLLVSLFALALLAAGGPLQAACSADRVDLRGDWGQARFNVEIADTDPARAQGLMNREYLPRSAGMLFIFDGPTSPSFWMRNTLIPLDMIFIDPTGAVTHVHHNAIPHDTTPIPGGDNVLMVLEINGGLARAMGIDTGSELRHPRLAPDHALWPCDP